MKNKISKYKLGGKIFKYSDGGINEKKPLVNWFSRKKEFEFGNVENNKGEPIIYKKTGNPLKKQIKKVDIPDSILGGIGRKKTVTTQEKIINTPGGIKPINLPIPITAPLLGSMGLMYGLSRDGMPLDNPNNTNYPLNKLAIMGGIGAAGLLGMRALGKEGEKKGFMYFNDNDSTGQRILKTGVSVLTGIPYKQKIGNYNSKSSSKLGKEKIVETEDNFDPNSPLIKTPRMLANGGIIPKYDFGGTGTGKFLDNNGEAIGAGLQGLSTLSTSFGGDPILNNSLSYAGQGASMGSMFGPWGTLIGGGVGALAGAGLGLMENDANDKLKQQYEQQKNSINGFKNVMGRPNNSTFGIKTNNQSMYANGGMKVVSNDHFNPTEEVEGGETAQLPNEENIEFNGPTHEEGGIKTNLPGGTRIFSDRLKSNGKTFAQIAKPIQSKISKLDNKPTSKALENTKMLFNKQLDNVFNEQESLKQEQEMKKNIFANGGIKKYSGLESYPSTIIKNNNIGTFNDPFNTKGINYSFQNEFTNNNKNKNIIVNNKTEPVILNNKLNNFRNAQAEYEALTKTPEGNFYMKNNVPNGKYINDNVIPQETVDITKGLSTNNTNWSEIGAGLTGIAGMIGQIRNNNSIKAPNAFQNVYLGNGPRPDMVDYSAELNAINNDFNSAKQGLRLGSGSYSTQVGNLGKLTADRLNARGKVMQTQENANTQLMNEYKNKVAENANKSQLMNFEIGKENEYNKLGYNQWKAKQNNEAIANATQIGTNLFNNRTGYNNQLDAAQIIANAHPDTVWKSTTKGRYKNGGMIKTKLKR